MHYLFTDESNVRETKTAKFFVYGGLIVDQKNFKKIDAGISYIRKNAGYLSDDSLKFDTRVRPEQVSIEACTNAKSEVLELCRKCGCRFIALLVHHKIAASETDPDRKYLWPAAHVFGRFNHYLNIEVNDIGMVFVDTLPVKSQNTFLSDCFTKGLSIKGESNVSLDKIRFFGTTCVNASNFASAIDIVLGAFRYCINEPKNSSAASSMIKQVALMMWHNQVGEKKMLRERGLILRPKTIKVASYQAEYDKLIEHLETLIKSP